MAAGLSVDFAVASRGLGIAPIGLGSALTGLRSGIEPGGLEPPDLGSGFGRLRGALDSTLKTKINNNFKTMFQTFDPQNYEKRTS